jgi:hypothetical protein
MYCCPSEKISIKTEGLMAKFKKYCVFYRQQILSIASTG